MLTNTFGNARGTTRVQTLATVLLAVVVALLFAFDSIVGFKLYQAFAANATGAEESVAGTTRMDALMIGDVALQDDVVRGARGDDGTYELGFVFDHVADQIAACDLCIANQETLPQATKSTGDAAADALRREEEERGFGIVVRPSDSAYLFERNGLKVGVLTYAALGDAARSAAEKGGADAQDGEGEGGNDLAELPYGPLIRADIAKVRDAGAEMVVACPRWGNGYDTKPSAEQRAYAQLFCDLGVDVVFGCHPRVLQPVELLKAANGHKTVCFYSMGVFMAATGDQAESCIGGIARVTLARDEDGLCTVDDARLAPTIALRTTDQHGGVYSLSDWTYKLARQSEMPYLTPDYVRAFCKKLLGAGFDDKAGVYKLDLVG